MPSISSELDAASSELDAARRALLESEAVRAQTEQELREARRDLEAAQAAGQVGTWVSELGPGGRLRWSRETYRIFGVPVELPVTVEGFFAIVHVDDRERVRRAVEQTLAGGGAYEVDHRIVLGDGSVRWVRACAAVERDAAGNPQRLIGTAQDVTDLRRAEDERDRFFAMAYDIFCIANEQGILRVNRAFERVLGYSDAELRNGRLTDFVHPEDVDRAIGERERLAAGVPIIHVANRCMAKDGTARWVDWTAVRDPDTGLIYASGRDITEQRALQDRLAQSQKLEAIGQLAGGIAHDFNNILSVIRGGAEMLRADLRPDDPLSADAAEIVAASERAASLTRQLLAFSRKQMLLPVNLDVAELVNGAAKLLRRLIGEHIELAIKLASDHLRIKADPSQIEQVLINLAVNARDAMPAGGRLSIETRAITLDAEAALEYGPSGLAPGEYVLIAVTDNGRGMDREVMKHLFEPFFTTKEGGKASGLGLATTYGIVRQSGGGIWVYSEPGLGTTFKICLPRIERGAPLAAREPAAASRGNGETILIVEDEPMVRHLVQRILRRAGFEVLEAANGPDALVLAERYRGTIHLLLTDMIMPRMNGRQLAERMATASPSLRVIYMSGYTDDAIVRDGVLGAEMDYVAKPVTPADLVRKIRAVLDR